MLMQYNQEKCSDVYVEKMKEKQRENELQNVLNLG